MRKRVSIFICNVVSEEKKMKSKNVLRLERRKLNQHQQNLIGLCSRPPPTHDQLGTEINKK